MILQLLPIFLCCGIVAQALMYKGGPCKMPDGTDGVCASLKDCPSVRLELRKYRQVLVCTKSPLSVCCPDAGRQSKQLFWPLSKWDKKPTVNERPRIGEIARRKCAEYSEHVYTTMYEATPFRRQKIRYDECATRGGTPLIVKGTQAEPREFPHMAAIGYDRGDGTIFWNCGGSIISERFILTAAHCTWDKDWGDAEWVRIGDLNLEREDDEADPATIRVDKRINHPRYKSPAKYHDIALLRLETKMKFNAWARPACLHTEPTTGTHRAAVATGWGVVGFLEEPQYDLRKVTLPIVDIKTCKKHWEHASNTLKVPNGVIEQWSICAGGDGGDTCQGDSGGPLLVPSKHQYCMYDIVGVTSVGQFCGFNVPGIYTRVYHYVPWIESIVWKQG